MEEALVGVNSRARGGSRDEESVMLKLMTLCEILHAHENLQVTFAFASSRARAMLEVSRQLAATPFSPLLNLQCPNMLNADPSAPHEARAVHQHHSRQCRLQPLDAGRVLGSGVGGLDGQRRMLGEPLVPYGEAVLGCEPRQSAPTPDHPRRQVQGIEPIHVLDSSQGQPGERRIANIHLLYIYVRPCEDPQFSLSLSFLTSQPPNLTQWEI